tara:strand:+ start:6647 stop:8011 length:1365 start_codon:yes stop_codon:yes gene_type:complete
MSKNIRIIDPVSFNNGRSAEFRLNESNIAYVTSGMYLSLGAYGTHAKLHEVRYNRSAGVASVVKSIRLLDGGVVLAQLDNAGQWMAWKGVNHDNADARSQKQASGIEGSLLQSKIPNADNQQNIRDSGASVPIISLGETESQACLGYVAIKDFLKELEVMRVLPTNVFTNLRLIVDFTTDVLTVAGIQEITAGAVSDLKISRPLLVCDVVTDAETINAIVEQMVGGLSFTGIESDSFILPALTAGRETVIKTLRGFNSKVVNRLLVVNSPTDTTKGAGILAVLPDGTTAAKNAMQAGKLNSLCQNRYTINARVNGKNIFSGRGLGYDSSYGGTIGAGYNHRLGVLYDTWGDTICSQMGNTCGLVATQLNATDAVNLILSNEKTNISHGADYTGFKIMDRVSHLEMTVERTFITAADKPIMKAGATNQLINQILYAEIPKTLTFSKNGRYKISYL